MFLVLLSSFVFGQSHATVSAGFTDVSRLVVSMNTVYRGQKHLLT